MELKAFSKEWFFAHLERTGKTQADLWRYLAKEVGPHLDKVKVHRMVHGARGPQPNEFLPILNFFGIKDVNEVARIVENDPRAINFFSRQAALAETHGKSPTEEPDAKPQNNLRSVSFSARTLAVFGMSAWTGDDCYVDLSRVSAEALCPPPLESAPNAYAVVVPDDSAEERFFLGETLYIDPSVAPRSGMFVLVSMRPAEKERRPRGYVRRFERWTADALIVTRMKPRMEISLPRSEVEGAHIVRLALVA